MIPWLFSSPPAVVWSALAASFSAIAAFLVWRIQRRNFLEATRPQIVLDDWKRQTVERFGISYDVLSFGKIRNVGKGVALHLYINGGYYENNFPLAGMATVRFPIIETSGSISWNSEITLNWKNVQVKANMPKFIPVKIMIYCWDTANIRHETTYNLFVTEQDQMATFTDGIADGVMLSNRATATSTVSRLRLHGKLGKIPFFRRLAKADPMTAMYR